MFKHEQELAESLLKRAGMEVTPADVEILAADLATVEYKEHVDRFVIDRSTENLFLRRLGGVGNLRSYMKCIRPKGGK